MIIKTKQLELQTKGKKITYFNITKDVEKFVEENNVKTGIVTVQSEHTTCSVFFEEMVHDFDIKGDEYLQVDLNKGLEKIYPNQESDGVYYRYPGPAHLKRASTNELFIADPGIALNGPAHLKATMLGASQTFVIEEGEIKKGN